VIPPQGQRWRRQALFAASLANLWMMPTWSALLPFAVGMRTHELAKPSREDYVAAVLVYLTLTGLILAGSVAIRRVPRPAIRWSASILLLGSLLIPVNLIRTLGGAFSVDVIVGSNGRLVLLAAAIVAAACLALARKQLTRAAIAFVLVLSPLAAVTLGESLWGIATVAGASGDAQRPARTAPDPPAEAGRVVVVVFDEWDYGATFLHRPADLKLPEIDRFDQNALHASAAYSPATSTLLSILALLSQKPVVAASGRADGGVDLTLDGRVVNLETVNVLFNRLHDQGVRTGLVGWAVPYCQVFGGVLDQCRQLDHGIVFRRPSALSDRMARQFKNLMPWYGKQSFVEMVRESAGLSERMAADGLLDVVWLHLPGPHLPVFYDRAARDYTMFKFDPARGYFDNLAWVDDTLGRLRAAMEQAGVWERTSVILTSDHSWTAAILPDGRRDPRVPMLVKLAGARHGHADEKPFNTMAMIDIIQQLLRDNTATYADVVRWLHGSAVSGLAPVPGS